MIIGVIETISAEAEIGSKQIKITIEDETGSGRDIFLTPRASLHFAQELLNALDALRLAPTLEAMLSIPLGVSFLVEND